MRIVVLTTFKEGYGGGTGRVAYDMAYALSKEHEVAFIRPADKTGILEKKGKLTVFGVKSKGRNHITLAFWTPKNKKAVLEFIDNFKPDVIHSNEPINLDTILMKYAHEKGIPFFYTGHILPSKGVAFFFPAKTKIFERIIYYLIFKPYIKEYLKFCDGVVALNEFSNNDHKKFTSEEKLFIIPNGKDLDKYKKAKIPSIKEDKIKLLYVGHIIPRKNQEYLIEAMKYLPENFELILVGNTLNSIYFNKVKKRIKELNLEKRVVFAGEVPHEEIVKYFEQAHIFVSAALLEVQSLVILESLATGTPVVGLSNETVDELIIDNYNGYRLEKDADPKEFAKRVLSIANLNEDSYKLLCDNCRETAKRFDWREVLKKTTEMYKTVKEQKTQPEKVPFGLNVLYGLNVALVVSFGFFYSIFEKIITFILRLKMLI